MARKLFYGAFEFKLACKRCGRKVAVNGPVPDLHCPHCDGPADIERNLIAQVLGKYVSMHSGLTGGDKPGIFIHTDLGIFCNFFKVRPHCLKCSKQLEMREVPEDRESQVSCGCGQNYGTFPIPDWLKKDCPRAVLAIGADREAVKPAGGAADASPAGGADAGDATDAAGATGAAKGGRSAAIFVACAQCGGGMRVTRATERAPTCTFCGSQVMVPDPVWERFHPVPRQRRWFVGFSARKPG